MTKILSFYQIVKTNCNCLRMGIVSLLYAVKFFIESVVDCVAEPFGKALLHSWY